MFFSVGDILQEAVRQIQPGVKVGKILIQRDESTVEKTPKLYYKKLPRDIADCFVILVDPMLATSGKIKKNITKYLKHKKVFQEYFLIQSYLEVDE